jgi:ketosteroid isomerase-like protein
MAEGNIEKLKAGIERYNARDIDGFLELAHSDLEWHSAFVAVEGSVFRGLDATRAYFEEIDRTWEVFQLRPQEFREVANNAVMFVGSAYGKGKTSGVEIDTPIWVLFWFREGKAYRGMSFLSEAEALDATESWD